MAFCVGRTASLRIDNLLNKKDSTPTMARRHDSVYNPLEFEQVDQSEALTQALSKLPIFETTGEELSWSCDDTDRGVLFFFCYFITIFHNPLFRQAFKWLHPTQT